MNKLDEQFTAAWYASALIWEVKNQVLFLEMFYSGTSNFENKGFGMWSADKKGNIREWPVYNVKKNFIKNNKKGSRIAHSDENEKIDILAVENEKGKFLTIVNKKDVRINTKLKIINADTDQLEISLNPYEVVFLEIK